MKCLHGFTEHICPAFILLCICKPLGCAQWRHGLLQTPSALRRRLNWKTLTATVRSTVRRISVTKTELLENVLQTKGIWNRQFWAWVFVRTENTVSKRTDTIGSGEPRWFPDRVFLKQTYETTSDCCVLPPISLIREFGKQNTRGNVSKISVNLTCYRQIGQSRSQSFVPLERSENESSGRIHFQITMEITEFCTFGFDAPCAVCIYGMYGACLKWMLPERFPTTGQGERSSGNEIADRIEIHQSQPLAWPSDLLYVMLTAVIGEFRSDLSITRKIDTNFGNISTGVLSKVAFQRKRW